MPAASTDAAEAGPQSRRPGRSTTTSPGDRTRGDFRAVERCGRALREGGRGKGADAGRTASGARRVRGLRAAQNRDATRFRRRQSAGTHHVCRRSARRRRRPRRQTFRRPLRPASRSHARRRSGSIARSAYITNVVPWRPPGNRTPTPLETAACLPFTRRHIELAGCEILVCLGSPSTQILLGAKDGIMRARGRWLEFDAGSRTIPAMPLLHPAFLLRQPGHKRLAWRDMRALAHALARPNAHSE